MLLLVGAGTVGWGLTLPPSRELKERLKPELLELIRQQRLHRLCQGTMFRKISSRRRQGQRVDVQDGGRGRPHSP